MKDNLFIKMYYSHNFQLYLKDIINILKDCDYLDLHIKKFHNKLDNYIDEFIEYLNCKNTIKLYI